MLSPEESSLQEIRLQITIARTTQILVIVAIALVMVSLAGQLAVRAFDWHPERDIVSMTNIDRERNIPTTFQALLMIGSAFGLAGIAMMKRLARDRWTLHWAALSLIIALVAWDEIIEVHERFIEPMRRAFDLQGFFFFGWIIPAGIAVAVLAFAYVRFILALPGPTRTQFILSAVTFLSGALIMEAIGGAYYESIDQNANMTYVLMATFEETLEKAGLIIFLHAVLSYLSVTLTAGSLTISGEAGRLWIDAEYTHQNQQPEQRGAIKTPRHARD